MGRTGAVTAFVIDTRHAPVQKGDGRSGHGLVCQLVERAPVLDAPEMRALVTPQTRPDPTMNPWKVLRRLCDS